MLYEYTYCSLKSRSFAIPPRKVEYLKILSVSFIQDYDLINETNNKVAIIEESDTTPKIASLPAGNYRISNFPAALRDALNSAGSQTYDVSYNYVTRRLTISTTGTKTFKILHAGRGTSAYCLMGSSRTQDSNYYKSITMKNPVDLSGSYPILLTSNISVRGVQCLSDFNEGEQLVVATMIPDNFGDVVVFDSSAGPYLSVDDVISKIEFHLIDSIFGNELSLNSPLTVRFVISDDINDNLD